MMSYGNDSDRPWVLDEARADPIIHRAVEAGITFFDTADVYSQGASEVATGRLVPRYLSRDEAVIATKVHGQMTPGPNGRGLSRKHILAAIDASLQRLDMDYVDLYQIHRWDPQTPIEETMEALHDVVRAGQGALHRRQQHARLAVRQGPARRRAQRLDALRLDAEPLQPPLPRGGARDDPAVHRPGRRRHPLEPAGARLPHRHAHPRGRAAHDARGDRRLPGRPLRPPRGLRRHRPPQRGGRQSASTPRRRSRSPGCCTSPASPPRSSAPPSSSTSRRPSPPPTCRCHPRRSSASRSPTCPTPCSATSSRRGRPRPRPQPAGDLGRAVQRLLPARLRQRRGRRRRRRQRTERGAARGLSRRRGPARRALRVRAPRHPAGARRATA